MANTAKHGNVRKLAFMGLFTALAMILSFVESLIPPLVAIQGVKIGLPNLVIMFMLYRVGGKEATAVSFVRVVLVSILFSSVLSMLYSLAGACLSLLGMILLKKSNAFSCVTVSVIGGVLHNVGQIVVACIVTETAQLVLYLPVLLISGVIAGIVIGLAAGLLIKRFEKVHF